MLNTKFLVAGAMAAGLTLAGCTVTAPEPPPPTEDCGAAALQDRIGQRVTGQTAADVQVGGEPVFSLGNVRIVGPDDIITMDLNTERLTLDVDNARNLVNARCV